MTTEHTAIIPPALLEIAERLRTQDNRCTANPLFIVQEKRPVGCEAGEGDYDVWLNEDWEEVDADHAARLDQYDADRYDDPDPDHAAELAKHTQRGVRIIWDFCMASFTEEGCKEYIDLNGHNLKEPRIYAESFNRCPEMLAIREFLLSLPSSAEVSPTQS